MSARLRAALTRPSSQQQAPFELRLSWEVDPDQSIILVVERRNVTTSVPADPEWDWRLFLGLAVRGELVLAGIAPSAIGQFRYSVRILDNATGKEIVSDSTQLSVSGVGGASIERSNVDVSVSPVITRGLATALRVVWQSEFTSDVLIEWEVRSVVRGVAEDFPTRTTRWDMNGWYVGDFQVVFPVEDPEGVWEWKFRLVHESTGETLASWTERVEVVPFARRSLPAPPPPPAVAPAPAVAPPAPPQPVASPEAWALGLFIALLLGLAVATGRKP